MTTTQDMINIAIGFTALPQSLANFEVGMLLVDTDEVPVDIRQRVTTQGSYKSSYTSGTDHYAWLTDLWSENYNPKYAYLGRWVSTATKAYRVMNQATTVASVYAGLTSTAKFELDDGTDQEDISPDFTGDTTMSDVATSITVALAASTDFASYTCTIDALDRLIIWGDTTGASALSFAVGAPASGVDLSGPLYLGTGFLQAGLDAESLVDAKDAALAIDSTPFGICQRGGSIAQVVALSTDIQSTGKFLILQSSDSDAKSNVPTTDFGYQIKASSHDQTYMVYTEHDDNIDASILGEILPRGAGKAGFNFKGMNVRLSGLGDDGTTVKDVTVDERLALEGKGYDYIVGPAGVYHLRNGLVASGLEARVVVGKLWMEAKLSEDVYAYMLVNDIVTFNDKHLQALKGILKNRLDYGVSIELLEPDYTITMPLASSFTASEKATHTLSLSDLGDITTQYGINTIDIGINWITG